MEPSRRTRWTRLLDAYGIRDLAQVQRDLGILLRDASGGTRYIATPSTLGLFRPDLSLPAYAGKFPEDGVAPIFNLFDRVGGGKGFDARTSRDTARDYRGGRLSYDEHDGTDFVCPRSTPLVAAAPGVAVAVRDTWLRGGLTLCLDHGAGVLTQYTHLSRVIVEMGQTVHRGEVIARSGVAGIDMLIGTPWVPPHVHFMVWVNGAPVDPYLAPGESPRAGAWAHGNDPRALDVAFPDDPAPPTLADIDASIDEGAVERVIEGCLVARIRDEITAIRSLAGRVAILEDSLHHDRPAWAPWAARRIAERPLRYAMPARDPRSVRLTLPLPYDRYRRATPVDAPWTRPS